VLGIREEAEAVGEEPGVGAAALGRRRMAATGAAMTTIAAARHCGVELEWQQRRRCSSGDTPGLAQQRTVRRTGRLGCRRAEERRVAVLATLGGADGERGSATAEKNGTRRTASDSGTRSLSAEGEAKREMPDSPAGFGQTGKRTEGWRRVAALAGMAGAWKKTPNKWAPRGSVRRKYDRRAPRKRNFPGFNLKPHFGSRLQ
jgi:hypothetical protein